MPFPTDRRGRRGPRRWSYTYADLAAVSGLTVGTLRNMVAASQFNPGDLASVVRFLVPRVVGQQWRGG